MGVCPRLPLTLIQRALIAESDLVNISNWGHQVEIRFRYCSREAIRKKSIRDKKLNSFRKRTRFGDGEDLKVLSHLN